jgi:glutamine synthetase
MEACIGAGEGLEPGRPAGAAEEHSCARWRSGRGGRSPIMPRWSEDADSQSIHLHVS